MASGQMTDPTLQDAEPDLTLQQAAERLRQAWRDLPTFSETLTPTAAEAFERCKPHVFALLAAALKEPGVQP